MRRFLEGLRRIQFFFRKRYVSVAKKIILLSKLINYYNVS